MSNWKGQGMTSLPAWVQRRVWDRRTDHWEHEGALGLSVVLDQILELADPGPETVAVDLGCGTGQLALPMARRGSRVTAVDVSPAMIKRLEEHAESEHLDGVVGVVAALERFDLPATSLDLAVSNYALHHLRDKDKRALIHATARWLRPGGRIVVGDMMFGRGATARDREIIRSKISVLVRRGPAGWWRVLKNVVRFTLRLRERPLSMEAWVALFEEAGFRSVKSVGVVGEAGIVMGVKD
ncbi:MAG: class I SAM-dependent methyltransferase [Acidimicrobiales bacterium]